MGRELSRMIKIIPKEKLAKSDHSIVLDGLGGVGNKTI
jgi:hypothetical protein